MNEIINALDVAAKRSVQEADFLGAAQIWAAFCLRNHYGTLLTAGLRVAQAIVEYDYLVRTPGKCGGRMNIVRRRLLGILVGTLAAKVAAGVATSTQTAAQTTPDVSDPAYVRYHPWMLDAAKRSEIRVKQYTHLEQELGRKLFFDGIGGDYK